jgi:hypothetical protein
MIHPMRAEGLPQVIGRAAAFDGRERAVAVVVIQEARLATRAVLIPPASGDEQVLEAVVIVITPGDSPRDSPVGNVTIQVDFRDLEALRGSID